MDDFDKMEEGLREEFDEDDFLRVYRGSEKFLTEGREYYDAFLKLLENKALLGHIHFANDVHKIPPLRSFVLYMRDVCGEDIFNKKMEAWEKQGLGACFGYLYKEIYKRKGMSYGSVQSWFRDRETEIKTASYFVKKGKE